MEKPMPLYEYVCNDCHREFELLIRGSERPACEDCGSERLTKLLSVPAAHSAGSTSFGQSACDFPSQGPCGMGRCGLPECG
jgi:putative FmdB family regulatory protein